MVRRMDGEAKASESIADPHSDERFASVFVTAPDGLTLHVRVASALPVVCLPGLARPERYRLGELASAHPGQGGWRPPIRGLPTCAWRYNHNIGSTDSRFRRS
jgi:hypothetical protein